MLNKTLTKAVAQLNNAPFDESDATQRAILFLLGAIHGGRTSGRNIAKITGLPRDECRALRNRALEQGLFQGAKIYASWDDKEEGGIALIMDSLVVAGFMERAH